MNWQNLIDPILIALGGGIAVILGILMGHIVNILKVWAVVNNGKIAVKTVAQLYPNLPNEEKKKMALAIAQSFNEAAGVKLPDDTQVSINEAHVFDLKTLPPEGGLDK